MSFTISLVVGLVLTSAGIPLLAAARVVRIVSYFGFEHRSAITRWRGSRLTFRVGLVLCSLGVAFLLNARWYMGLACIAWILLAGYVLGPRLWEEWTVSLHTRLLHRRALADSGGDAAFAAGAAKRRARELRREFKAVYRAGVLSVFPKRDPIGMLSGRDPESLDYLVYAERQKLEEEEEHGEAQQSTPSSIAACTLDDDGQLLPSYLPDELDQLADEWKSRPTWIGVNSEVIDVIARNAHDDTTGLKRLIAAAEMRPWNLVETYFEKFLDSPAEAGILAWTFGRKFRDTALDIISSVQDVQCSEERTEMVQPALAMLGAAMLCEPGLIEVHVLRAIIWQVVGRRDMALQSCDEYRRAKARLMGHDTAGFTSYEMDVRERLMSPERTREEDTAWLAQGPGHKLDMSSRAEEMLTRVEAAIRGETDLPGIRGILGGGTVSDY
jgi:hypothetical protein